MTAVRTFVLAAAMSMGFAGAAFARGEVFTIQLEAPAAQSQIIAQNTVWSCEGNTCVARPNHAATARSCRQFAREAGVRVTAYGPENDPLSSDELARCNGDEAATLQAQN